MYYVCGQLCFGGMTYSTHLALLPADRLVGIEYGDPLVHTLIPSENYRFPTPCGHMVLKGNIPGDCYISVYANGPDLDTTNSISRTFINGIEIIMKKHSNETRMIVNTGVVRIDR